MIALVATLSNSHRPHPAFCRLILLRRRGVRGLAFAVIVVGTTVGVAIVVRAIPVRSLVSVDANNRWT
jgi:hypothetical protein